MLKTAILGALALSAAGPIAGVASAQSMSDPTTTTVCIDVSGRSLPVTCRAQAGRLNQREDICQCLDGGREITIPICPTGVRPPAESAAYERARLAAINKGSLVGAMWQGKPMCVAPRNPVGGQ